MHDGLELCLVVEGQTANANFREQVVFAHFAPAVIAVVVEGSVEAGIVHVGRELVFFAFLCPAVEEAERDDAHIAAKAYHLDAVRFVFLDDVVTDLLLWVATLHRGIDVFQGHDAGADALVVVKVEIFAKTRNPFLGGDDQHVVSTDGTVAMGIGAQHIGVLCQTLDGLLVFGREPELAAMVIAAHGGLDGYRHGAGITDLACGGHILHWREATESEGHAVQVLCIDATEVLCRINTP